MKAIRCNPKRDYQHLAELHLRSCPRSIGASELAR